MRKSIVMLIIGGTAILASCASQLPHHATVAKPPPPPTKIDDPTLSCEEANRIAYKTVNVMGYTATSVTVATPGGTGEIIAEREGTRGGKVVIQCHTGGGASVEGFEGGLPIPSLVGGDNPHKFYNQFRRSFVLVRESETRAEQVSEKGFSVKMSKLNGVESRIEFGVDLPASGVQPVKVLITNNSPRPYGFDASQVFAMSASGGRVTPMAPPAAGQGKALQGEMTIAPGQTVSGYLFYPGGNYTSARTTVVDKENDEGEGFQVQF
ncbi:MAG: hypothetical protein AB7G75_35040 [Candidatus Binatia bacterium]